MKSKEIRNKILLDLFITPLSLIPIACGISTSLISFAINQYGNIFFIGVGLVLFGVGAALSNFILNWSEINKKALDELKDHAKKENKKKLDLLYLNLTKTRDTQDENFLISLTNLYEGLLEDVEKEKINIPIEVISQIDKIYQECIESLSYSYELFLSAINMPKGQKQNILDKRTLVLKEIDDSLNLMTKIIAEFRTLEIKEKQIKLNQLREDLQSQLQSAKNAKDQMLSIEYDQEKDYSEYLDKSS